MKFLIFARLRIGATFPEDALTLFQQTIDWINVRLADGTFDCAYNLPAGGGVAIVNADSHETLTDVLSAYPLQPWVQYEVQPLSDIKHAFGLTIKALGG
jgi:muconolactone delta-isomerase